MKKPKLTCVHTYRHKEFLDLVHSVCHAQVTIRNGGKNLNINVQLHGQMGIFWISTLSQLLLLHMRLQQQKHLILVTVNLVFSVSSAFMFSYMDSTVYLVFVSHRAFPQHWNLGPCVFLQTFNCASLRPQNLAYKIKLRTKYKLDANPSLWLQSIIHKVNHNFGLQILILQRLHLKQLVTILKHIIRV